MRKGSRRIIVSDIGEINLLYWEICGTLQWCISLKELSKILGMQYRPSQIISRLSEENWNVVTRDEFEGTSIWDYDELFSGQLQYLVNIEGIKEILLTSKKKNRKKFLKVAKEILENIE